MSIRNLLDGANQHLRALDSLGRPVNANEDLLVAVLLSKLNNSLHKEFEEKIPGRTPPTLSQFSDFLNHKSQILESINSKEIEHKRNAPFKPQTFLNVKNKCNFCNNPSHLIYNCPEFLTLRINQRINEIKKLRLCLNCLNQNHSSSECTSGHCRKCNKKHSTLLHLEFQRQESGSVPEVSLFSHSQTAGECPSQVLLSTANIQIFSKQGDVHYSSQISYQGNYANF